LDVDGELTEVPELAGARADLWLLNDGGLAYTKVRLDPHSLAMAMKHLRHLDDPLARTPLWSATWDMVRDGELPARRSQPLVLAPGPPAAPDQRSERTAAAADAVWELTGAADAGSDAQLQFLESFTRLAPTPPHREILRGLLAGSTTVVGRTIDTDLRWKLVI